MLDLTENLYDTYTRHQETLYESLLRSYSPKKLISALERKFGKSILQYIRPQPSEYDKLCVVGFTCTEENENILRLDTEFQSILNLYNYTFSYSYPIKRNGHEVKVCVLEPNIPGDYTKIVYEQWNGIVYHITTIDKVDSILKNGLRAKSGTYREFDNRVFVTGGEDLEENLLRISSNLGDYQEQVVLKIDLKKNSHKIRFFRDPMQVKGLGLYTKENIDSRCITVYRR